MLNHHNLFILLIQAHFFNNDLFDSSIFYQILLINSLIFVRKILKYLLFDNESILTPQIIEKLIFNLSTGLGKYFFKFIKHTVIGTFINSKIIRIIWFIVGIYVYTVLINWIVMVLDLVQIGQIIFFMH